MININETLASPVFESEIAGLADHISLNDLQQKNDHGKTRSLDTQ